MITPPLPVTEIERLTALHRLEILDTPAEERFDRITRLATRLFNVPIALVSLIDENRQWFKSCQGLNVRETSRDISFCGHAILRDKPLVIPDALEDKRFYDNPLVRDDPYIRFYAGQPLADAENNKLGTLCLIDRQPRRFEGSDLEALKDLAVLVEQELNNQQLNEAMKLVRNSETRLRTVQDNILDGIITFNRHGKVESFNPAAEKIFGFKSTEIIGQPVYRFLSASYGPEYQQYLAEYLRTRKFEAGRKTHEVEGCRKDGTIFPMELTLNRMVLDRQLYFIAIVRDIGERKAIEQMKEEFIATVSHELRTPLTAIRGALGLVQGGVAGEIPPPASAMLEIAHKNSERLLHLINDILDIEKIESGKMRFEFSPVDLGDLISQTIEMNQAYAEQFKVNYRLEENLPGVKVKADADRLVQVLTNLLSNAAKFSPPNSPVLITILRRPEQMVRVAVIDRGNGIPEEFQERIFQKFAQADSSATRKKGGTGLGLSISKAIIEKHGGQIGFETSPGCGSTFYFELPECQN